MGSDLLIQAFENFRQASSSLERVHQELSRKVAHLSRKLEEKNRELELNLVEKEEIRSFLDNILSNLVNAVLVVDRCGQVKIANKTMTELLATEPAATGVSVLPAQFLTILRGVMRQKNRRGEVILGEKVLLVSGTLFRSAGDADELMVFVFDDITELRRLEAERERQARLSAMGEMAIQLAHEIRNPLAGIQLYLSLLKSEATSPEERQGWIRHMEAGLTSINYIVTNMLQFYKPLQMRPEFFSPVTVAEESIALLQPVIQTRGVQVFCQNSYGTEVIQADREMLRQLCLNLLRNALSAMPEGGRIAIQIDGPMESPADNTHPYCRLTVDDNGVGMDEEEQKKIFEPFWSGHTGGYGIGMWVSRQIITQHGGQIHLNSQRGLGTTIQVFLPVQAMGES